MKRRRDRCFRCGRPVPWGVSACRVCNPAGLPSPSRSQYHATVFIVVLLTLAIVALWFVVRG